MTNRSVVSEKGQVTIPKPLRDRLGTRPGQVLDVSEERGRLVAAKATIEDPVAATFGILNLGQSTDEMSRDFEATRTPCDHGRRYERPLDVVRADTAFGEMSEPTLTCSRIGR